MPLVRIDTTFASDAGLGFERRLPVMVHPYLDGELKVPTAPPSPPA